MRILAVLGSVFLIGSFQLYAADNQSVESFQPKATGVIDIRPSWTTKEGSLGIDSSFELGYKFTKDFSVSYYQGFTHNFYSPSSEKSGFDVNVDDALVRAKINNLWTSSDSIDSFHYQPRVYLPTKESRRDQGYVATLRNYFTLSHKFNDAISLSASVIPIYHFYTRAGTYSGDSASANPSFENRVYLIADFNFTEKLSLSVPLMFHQTRYRDFDAAATSNDSWGFTLWTWPELTYAIDENFSTGLAFSSGNFVASDLSGVDFLAGLEDGVFQVVFGAKI